MLSVGAVAIRLLTGRDVDHAGAALESDSPQEYNEVVQLLLCDVQVGLKLRESPPDWQVCELEVAVDSVEVTDRRSPSLHEMPKLLAKVPRRDHGEQHPASLGEEFGLSQNDRARDHSKSTAPEVSKPLTRLEDIGSGAIGAHILELATPPQAWFQVRDLPRIARPRLPASELSSAHAQVRVSQTCRQDGAVRLEVETDVQVRSTRLTVLPESLQAFHTFGTGFAVAVNVGGGAHRSTVGVGREVGFSNSEEDILGKMPTSRERSVRSADVAAKWVGAPAGGTPTFGTSAVGSKSSKLHGPPFSAATPSPVDGVSLAAEGLGVADSATAVTGQSGALTGCAGAVDPECVEAACALRTVLRRVAPTCISSVKVRAPQRHARFPAPPLVVLSAK